MGSESQIHSTGGPSYPAAPAVRHVCGRTRGQSPYRLRSQKANWVSANSRAVALIEFPSSDIRSALPPAHLLTVRTKATPSETAAKDTLMPLPRGEEGEANARSRRSQDEARTKPGRSQDEAGFGAGRLVMRSPPEVSRPHKKPDRYAAAVCIRVRPDI
jgi:hypothetical protein